jgi:hypothetical protein
MLIADVLLEDSDDVVENVESYLSLGLVSRKRILHIMPRVGPVA